MNYDQDVPQRDEILSVSQPKLLNNNQVLFDTFGVNHVSLASGDGNEGKHKYCSYVEQAEDPETKGDEYVVYSKESGGNTELFARPESNGTAHQITKDGELFVNIIPAAAVNFENNGTMRSSFNVASVTGGSGSYTITFSDPLPDDNYFWEVSGFNTSDNAIVGQVRNATSYNTVVRTTDLKVQFRNKDGLVTNIEGASVIVWRVQ